MTTEQFTERLFALAKQQGCAQCEIYQSQSDNFSV
jgi:hypothetical protein